jgi:hypothetical protein
MQQTILSEGIEVDICEDFLVADALVAETGRLAQTPMFALGSQDFTAAEAFWLFAFQEGLAIGGTAARVIDLRHSERLDDYIHRTSAAYFGPNRIASVARLLGDEMKGKIIYLGELEFSSDHRGSTRLLGAFVQLVQVLAATKWQDFDWMFCYVPKRHVKFIDLYNFTIQIPSVITWRDPAPARMDSSHAMFAISRAHFEHFLKVFDQ